MSSNKHFLQRGHFTTLPDDVFNTVRSFGTFEEIHHQRAVAKRWVDIDNIPKDVYVSYRTVADMVHANMKNIYQISFHRLARRTKQIDIDFFSNAISTSRNSIKRMSLATYSSPEPFIFPNLQWLRVEGVTNINVDFEKIPSLRSLQVYFDSLHFILNAKNKEKCQIQKWKVYAREVSDIDLLLAEECLFRKAEQIALLGVNLNLSQIAKLFEISCSKYSPNIHRRTQKKSCARLLFF